MRKLFEIMEICSNVCSLRDAPLSRLFSVSELLIILTVKTISRQNVRKIKQQNYLIKVFSAKPRPPKKRSNPMPGK